MSKALSFLGESLPQTTRFLFNTGVKRSMAIHRPRSITSPVINTKEGGGLRYSTGSAWEVTRDPKELIRAQEEIERKFVAPNLASMPVSKFMAIGNIPWQVKDRIAADTSLAIIAKGMPSLFNPATISLHAEKLGMELSGLARNGDKDAQDMLELIKGVSSGKITHAHIQDSMPALEISGFKDEALQEVMGSVVSVDNKITSVHESYAIALKNAPNIVFTYAFFNLLSKANMPLITSPINCLRTTHNEAVHSQPNKFGERVSAAAFVGIDADGSVVTYFVDSEQIVHFLDEGERQFLMEKNFYHPESLFGTKSPSKQFSILENIGGKWCLRLDEGTFIVDHDGLEGYNRYNLILEKIDYVVARLLEEEKVTEVPITTGTIALVNNFETPLGRHTKGVPSFNNKEHDTEADLKTEAGNERRVMGIRATPLASVGSRAQNNGGRGVAK